MDFSVYMPKQLKYNVSDVAATWDNKLIWSVPDKKQQ